MADISAKHSWGSPALKVLDVVRWLFPEGTMPYADPGVREAIGPFAHFPIWPPDLYALAASLAESSSCYTAWDPADVDLRVSSTEAEAIGIAWATTDWEPQSPPITYGRERDELQEMWERFLALGDSTLDELSQCQLGLSELARLIVQFMIVADTASVGVGFESTDKHHWVAFWVNAKVSRLARAHLDASIASLCRSISPNVLAVLPKARTPNVGCNLRSLSHHLCLCPPTSQVSAAWQYQPVADSSVEEPEGPRRLNLLVVPFPFGVPVEAFSAEPGLKDGRWAWFSVKPQWLPEEPGLVEKFLIDLLDQAARESGPINGLILPELSISEEIFQELAERLRDRPHFELLLAGVAGRSSSEGSTSGLAATAKNSLMVRIYDRREITPRSPRAGKSTGSESGPREFPFTQRKHHRWKLDRGQVDRYGLGGILYGAETWWEHIDVSRRSVRFYQIHAGTVLSALICEDLARIDPCQSILRAVGPNLLFALLMDGPQLEKRWPGRYATALADDPVVPC